MTSKEYTQYCQDVEDFFKREGLSNLTAVADEEGNCEPHFSWSSCHCCGSTLGGDREDCNGYNPTTGEVQDGYSVCVDCVYYAEYGRLDDMTMASIEETV